MDFSFLINALVSALILPFQLILVPIDALLSNIDGIEVIPNSINTVVSFLGTIPQTLVVLAGINPLLWNTLILVYVAYLGLVPAVNGIKKIIAWIT